MGTYIVVGPCYEFNVDIRGVKEEELDIVRKNASQFIDTDAFNCSIEDGWMSFTAKEEMFFDGFVKLVERQYELWGVSEHRAEEAKEILDKISNVKNLEELVSLADEKMYEHFQSTDDYWYVKSNFGRTCPARVHTIILYMEGKAMLECFVGLFSGIEKLIKLDCTVPASRFMKVILTS